MGGMKIKWGTIGWSAFAIASISGVAVLSQTGPLFPPAPAPADQPATSLVVETPEPTITPTPIVTPTPTPTPEPVVEAPAPPPPPPAKSGAPSGTPLPFYPSSDPQNAEGGQYADPASFCANGSASTVNGVPTCD